MFSWAHFFISSAIALEAYLRVCGSLSGNFSVDMLVIMLFLKIFFNLLPVLPFKYLLLILTVLEFFYKTI